MEADWKRKMSLIQTRWPSEKSSNTHRTTENTFKRAILYDVSQET